MSQSVAIVEPANLIPYYVRSLCRGLIEAGQDLTFYTSRYQHSEMAPEAFERHLYFSRGLSQFLPTSSMIKRIAKGIEYPLGHRRLVSEIRKSDCDIVHLQWARLPRLDSAMINRVRSLGRKFVYTIHDVEPLYSGHGSKAHHRHLTLTADAVIVHSEWAKQQLVLQFPELNLSKVAVVEHPPLIQPTQNLSAQHCRRLLNIPGDAFHVLFFGSLKAFKGLDFYTNWIQSLTEQQKFSKVCFTIAGSPSAPNIENMIRSRLGNNSRVNLVLKYIPESEEEVYFKACDLVALPYEKISQSGVLATAFAYHKPVLATAVGNFSEQTDNGRRGVSLSADAQKWTQALEQLLLAPSMLRDMEDNIRDYIHTELNWPMAAEKTIAVYDRLRGRSRKQVDVPMVPGLISRDPVHC